MLELFDRIIHWFFTPNYIKVAERDLAISRLKLLQYASNEHYSRLMVDYYQGCMSRDKALLDAVTVAATQQIADSEATFTGRTYT